MLKDNKLNNLTILSHDKIVKYIKDFLNYLKVERDVSIHTFKSYKLDLQQLLKFWENYNNQDDKSINQDKNVYFDYILDKFINHLNYSVRDASSIARKISCFSSFKKFLQNQGYIIKTQLKRPMSLIGKPKVFNIDKLLSFLNSINLKDLPTRTPLRDTLIIELLYATGIRCSELILIELKDIHLEQKSIIIRTAKRKERIVFFNSKSYSRLIKYMKYERIKSKSEHERLLLSCRNNPLTSRSVQRICKIFNDILQSSIPLTPSVLRNSYAAHMIKNGVDIESLQKLLGHKTRISTEKYLNLD